jgi:ADP-ribose pyrophosphatase YjhB (NUDIX family)
VLSIAERVRRQPAPAALALLAGLVAGLLLGWIAQADPSSPRAAATTVVEVATTKAATATTPAKTTAPASTGATAVPAPDTGRRGDPAPAAVRPVLEGGVRAADTFGGTSQVAVFKEGWAAPVVVGDAPNRPMRMWSISKAVTAIAVFETQPKPSEALRTSIMRALTRSENCAQRRVVLGLQALSKGGVIGAEAAVADVLARAGANVTVRPEAQAPEQNCLAYLTAHRGGLADIKAPAALLGTVRWTLADAVRFAAALGRGHYGAAGNRVLQHMARAKLPSEDPGAVMTAPLNWGAGAALAGLDGLAYKGGWGGSASKSYMAAQIAVVTVDGRHVAMAAAFHPTQQPANDDPGLTKAPQALATLFDAARRATAGSAP